MLKQSEGVCVCVCAMIGSYKKGFVIGGKVS